MIWWHRAVLGHEVSAHQITPVFWWPSDGYFYRLECSCGKEWLR